MPLDLSAMKAPTPPPAAKRGPGRPRKTETVSRTSLLEARTQGLLGLVQLGQAACIFTKQYADAAAIGLHGPSVAVEIAKVAETEETVAKAIDFLVQVGPYGALISALLPLGLQLAANHGLIGSAGIAGIVPPDLLRSQMEASLLQQQAEAARTQRQAMADAQAATRELREYMAAAAGQDDLDRVNGHQPTGPMA